MFTTLLFLGGIREQTLTFQSLLTARSRFQDLTSPTNCQIILSSYQAVITDYFLMATRPDLSFVISKIVEANVAKLW